MFKRNPIIVLVALILTLIVTGIPAAWAQDPTIPTRTPTPDPNQPNPPPSATPGDAGAPPPPEATDPSAPGPGPGTGPGASPTTPGSGPGTSPGSGPGSPAATSPSGALPGSGTSGAGQQPGTGVLGTCDETPYVQAILAVTVYAGPGHDYQALAELGAEDMRPIIGRAFYTPWWQIQFDPVTIGWVADAEVNETGNTALVPLAIAPEINGNTPTPGPFWNPTPLPLLTCVPTPTPTPSPTATGTIEASPGLGGGVSGSEGGGGEGQGDAQAAPAGGMVSAEVGSNAPVAEEEIISGSGISSRNAEASRAASPTSAMNLILPLAGLALISGGIVLALVSRKQGGANTGASDSTD